MGLADIATLVLQRVADDIASPVGELSRAIEDSPAAEPGPTDKVRPFSAAGTDATEAALLAKLGARVFQRARERRVEDAKKAKLLTDQRNREHQLERLDEVAATGRARLEETIRHNQTVKSAAAAKGDDDPVLTVDPDTGKPLPTPMKQSRWLTYRGQNKTSERAAAARTLREKLSREAAGTRGRATASADAARLIAGLPKAPELRDRAWSEALATADAEAVRRGRPFKPDEAGQKLRLLAAKQVYPDIFLRHVARLDSARVAPLRIISEAAGADSMGAAQDLIPADFQALFEDLD